MPERKTKTKKRPTEKQRKARAKFTKAAKYRKAHPGTSMKAAMEAVK